MIRPLLALASGLLFGAGLAISDMMNPARVLAFLDVAGAWDYSLALVMGGALIPSSIACVIQKRMRAPVCGGSFSTSSATRIDLALVGGAVLFGLGWGLSGFCPGPALVAPTSGNPDSLWFLGAMLMGMVLHRLSLGRATSNAKADA